MGQGSVSVHRYALGFIRPRHMEIARRLACGERQVDIAADLGMTEGRLSIIVNSPLFKLELDRLMQMRDEGVASIRKELDEQLVSMQPIFNSVVASAMTNDDLKVALQGATLWAKATGKVGTGSIVNVQVNNSIAPVDYSKYRTDGENNKGECEVVDVESNLVPTPPGTVSVSSSCCGEKEAML